MGHYSLWLEKYDSCRDRILSDLKGHKARVDEIRAQIDDKNLILPLPESRDFEAKMAFVDGGEGIRELLGASIYFIKASGLVTEKNGSEKSDFFIRDLDMNVLDHDDYTKERVELLRGGMEFDVALRCLEECDPEYLFIDGSLYVSARQKPIECEEYIPYREKYVRFLKAARKNKTHILGVSEDSKSRLFANYLSIKYRIKFPRFMTDSCILRVLQQDSCYRTVEFTPQSDYASDDRFASDMTLSFPTVYLQPTAFSNPLRIDVPDWERDLEKILSLVCSLSRGSGAYGYPLPLYLAHLDAHIKSDQADWSTQQIIHHACREDPGLYNTILSDTRRQKRPR